MEELQELMTINQALVNALKEYEEFIERIESTTTDEIIAYKIRTFLTERKIWKT